MAIHKRYKGRRLKRSDRDWYKGTWWIEFSLRGNYVHESIPGARTQAQAERAESKRREEIYEGKYDPGKKLFSEFVDETFLPWSRANKRSHREDEQRSVTLKDFFGEKHLRDIKPMMIETFKRERLATPTKHDKEDRPRPRTPASVNRDLACLSKILSMAFDNELIDSNPMRRVRLLKRVRAERGSSQQKKRRNCLRSSPADEITFAPSSPLLLTRGCGAVKFSDCCGNT